MKDELKARVKAIYPLYRAYQFYRSTRWLVVSLRFLGNDAHLPIQIVTGADRSHYRSLMNLLKSVREHEPEARVNVWDLGLLETQLQEIAVRFPKYRIKKFPFDEYPSYFDIRVAAGEYAWKPVIICGEAAITDRIVVWLDAGNIVTSRLTWVRRLTDSMGLFSPYSSGTISQWTHPGTLAALGVREELLSRRNLAACLIAVDPLSDRAMVLLKRWEECALCRDCIAPVGSDRNNHRQDQAVFTVLSYQEDLAPSGFLGELTEPLGVRTHQDVE